MSSTSTYYVTQYGAWWRLTKAQWIALCKEGLEEGGYVLPDAARLRRRPGACVGVDDLDGDGCASYYAKKPGVEVRQPLDWSVDEFREELKALNAYAQSQSAH